ncbi:MAG: 8-amino-7-oxononanoate synthase [bacterium]|nr:MAG: 8-amino-7-oxononanoate synthase [bacterium]
MSTETPRPQGNPFKHIMDSKVGTVTTINGKDYLYFAGTGYFQLQSHPAMIQAAVDATTKFGIGCATSRTITGTTQLLLKLEKRIADFFGTEDAAYLPSGYLSNMAGFQALERLGVYDVIFIDESSHYSNMGGALVSGKKVVKFKHLDVENLRKKIKKRLKKGEKPLVASDGLFAIWAEPAPADEYLKIAEEFNGAVWIDDAHGVGILGENGRGIYEFFHLKSERLFMGATLSKAFGAYGGFITGNTLFINILKSGNVMTGTSSPPHAMVSAALKGLELVNNNPELRRRLWDNAIYLKGKVKELGIAVDDNVLPIVTFSLKSSERMMNIQHLLMNKGIYIQFVKYIGSGVDGVLRIVITSEHTKEEIDFLVSALSRLL